MSYYNGGVTEALPLFITNYLFSKHPLPYLKADTYDEGKGNREKSYTKDAKKHSLGKICHIHVILT